MTRGAVPEVPLSRRYAGAVPAHRFKRQRNNGLGHRARGADPSPYEDRVTPEFGFEAVYDLGDATQSLGVTSRVDAVFQ